MLVFRCSQSCNVVKSDPICSSSCIIIVQLLLYNPSQCPTSYMTPSPPETLGPSPLVPIFHPIKPVAARAPMLSTDETECKVWNCLLRYFISPEGYQTYQRTALRCPWVDSHVYPILGPRASPTDASRTSPRSSWEQPIHHLQHSTPTPRLPARPSSPRSARC
jgi:hypothetical protein